MNLCALQDFLKSGESDERRCDSAESLEMRKCDGKNVINHKPDTAMWKNNELNNDLKNVVQLKPQAMKVQLRIGEEEIIYIM